jgi:hypothetical protein
MVASPQTEPEVLAAIMHGLDHETSRQGLSIEGQVRKKWDPKKGGLPIF